MANPPELPRVASARERDQAARKALAASRRAERDRQERAAVLALFTGVRPERDFASQMTRDAFGRGRR